MGLNEILLVIAALVPAIVLAGYVYKKDRAEKEPIGLLLILLALGALSCLPAGIIESIITYIIDGAFGVDSANLVFTDTVTETFYQISSNFIGIAFVEEGLKWLILFFVTRKNKNFNSLFDGLIYAVFVSLGFAALENVLYVVNNGWGTAIMRAVMSVPGHTFNAVIMGYYYSLWNVYKKAGIQEKMFSDEGLLTLKSERFSSKKYLVLSLVAPTFVHGLYDFCCSFGTLLSTVSLYLLVIFLYIYCFKKIKKISVKDTSDVVVSFSLLCQKYPELRGNLAERNQNAASEMNSI